MKEQGQNLCAVCGWRFLKAPQRSASGGASHEICPSCGFEPGYTDDDQGITLEQWRKDWVQGGLKWFGKGIERPVDWNPMRALHSLLRRKRPVIPLNRLRRAKALREAKPVAEIPQAKTGRSKQRPEPSK